MDNHFREQYIRLGQNIAYYRRLAQLSQEQVADALDISYAHISRLENAASAPSVDLLFKIAPIIKTTVSQLFIFGD